MATSAELAGFVKEGLLRGVPRKELDVALRQAGWDRAQVSGALRQFAEVDFSIPVPRPAPYLDAREAFLYAVMFATLYFSAYNVGILAFELIDRAFPDPTARDYAIAVSEMTLRWSLSAIIVAFPVFLYVARLTARERRADPGRRASRVRRQLTYLTLFIAAAFLIGDVTTLVYNLLGGEMTVRFALKVLTVAVIAGTGFGHYLRELRRDDSALPTGSSE
jgi:hypothetical protein